MGIRVGMGLLAWICLPAVAVTLLGVLDFVFYGDLRPVEDFLFARRPVIGTSRALSQAVVAAGTTLGAGLGVGMALGAQAPPGLPWGRSVIAVAVLDTLFSSSQRLSFRVVIRGQCRAAGQLVALFVVCLCLCESRLVKPMVHCSFLRWH